MLDARELLDRLAKDSVDYEDLGCYLKGGHSGSSSLLKLCKMLESTYYSNRRSFSKAKKNLAKIIECNIFDELDEGCLNCFLMADREKAEQFFYNRISEIDASWLSFLLGTSIGRNVKLALDTYENKRKELTKPQKNVYEKYVVSQKVGVGFNELNNKKFDHPVRKGRRLHSPPMKIAVCVSGQLRGFEEAKKSMDCLLSGHNVDYFVHVWSEVGGVKKEAFKNKRIQPQFLNRFFSDLEERRPDIYRRVCSYVFNEGAKVDKNSLMNVYGKNARIELEDDCSRMSNPEKMHYKIKGCFDLIENPSEYDLVVRVRPDLVVKERCKIDWQEIHHAALEGVILAGYGYTLTYYGFGVDDKIAIASPERMQLYANFWNEREKYSPVVGHASLAEYLFDNEVHVVSMSSVLEVSMNDTKSIDENFIRIIAGI